MRNELTAFHLAQLRHAYAQLHAGTVKDQRQFADGLLAPVIRAIEAVMDSGGPSITVKFPPCDETTYYSLRTLV